MLNVRASPGCQQSTAVHSGSQNHARVHNAVLVVVIQPHKVFPPSPSEKAEDQKTAGGGDVLKRPRRSHVASKKIEKTLEKNEAGFGMTF